MTQLIILNAKEKNVFDNPPVLSKEERKLYFHLDSDTRRHVSQLKNQTNRLGYVLQLGYFKARAKFYPVTSFRKRDINYVMRLLGIPKDSGISTSDYQLSTHYDHQKRVLDYLGWNSISGKEEELLLDHAQLQASQQKKPLQIFMKLIDYCWKHQIVIPTYTELAEYVTESYNAFEAKILGQLKGLLSNEQDEMLDSLIMDSSAEQHPITLLKRIDQSSKPRDIAKSVELCKELARHHSVFASVIDSLNLTDQATEYYATWVQKARTAQLTNLANRERINLHLLSFIKHQYFSRQDALTHIFLKSVRKSLNLTKSRLDNNDINSRKERNEAIKTLTKASKSARQLVEDIKLVSSLPNVTPSEKYYKIDTLLKEFENEQPDTEKKLIEELEAKLESNANGSDFYKIMEDLSRSLQLRASGILKVLEFNQQTSNPELINAIQYFKATDGKVTEKAPIKFLKPKELKFVNTSSGFNVSLYKYLLFLHCADGIKSGDLNLIHSYEFRAIDDYLIPLVEWRAERDKLITMAELGEYNDIEKVLADLKLRLHKKYVEINESHANNTNSYLSLDDKDRLKIKTPKTNYDESEFVAMTLSQSGYIPVQQALSEINSACSFVDTFSHHSNKHAKMKPKVSTIIAGIVGIGCNIGLNKLANISLGVSENSLKNTVTWLFDLRTIQAANDKIVQAINGLDLAKSFRKDVSRILSSSDGRKVGVAVDSILANKSFKYFGKDQGVVVYTFIDERQSLYYSTVISASEREAPYVIDGLLQNDTPQNITHSVDEYGFSESVHAATHLVGASFAPRFKQINKKSIYAFSSKSTYKKQGFKILPNNTINQNLIRRQWENVLRFIATIKLNRASASQLFKRLSSYAKENPLYKALKEFGRIIKSIYILTYCNDVELRQEVQKNQNRIELSNKFAHAVFFDNDQELQVGLKEEQELAMACKILIQNAIVLWNYLYLSNMLVNIDNDCEREEFLSSIHGGSLICWRHINLRGTYDFRRRAANEPRFNMDEIRQLKIA